MFHRIEISRPRTMTKKEGQEFLEAWMKACEAANKDFILNTHPTKKSIKKLARQLHRWHMDTVPPPGIRICTHVIDVADDDKIVAVIDVIANSCIFVDDFAR